MTSASTGFGSPAPDFGLRGVDGERLTLASSRGPNGLLVMFICNHCPYVKTVRERLVRDCTELAGHGVGSLAIMSNDPGEYPEDSFESMQKIAAQFRYPFPYLLDETQDDRPDGVDRLLDQVEERLAGALRAGAALRDLR